LHNSIYLLLLDTAHERVVRLILLDKLIENRECLNIEEDPSLLCLCNDTPKERRAVLDQVWVL